MPCGGCSVLTRRKGCILRTMDTINSKGVQHLLVNVVVFLDLNIQTTIFNEFAPAIKGRETTDSSGGREAIR